MSAEGREAPVVSCQSRLASDNSELKTDNCELKTDPSASWRRCDRACSVLRRRSRLCHAPFDAAQDVVLDADGDVGHELIDIIVRADINQYNGIFASLGIRRKQEDDPAVVFHRTCPQSIKAPLSLCVLSFGRNGSATRSSRVSSIRSCSPRSLRVRPLSARRKLLSQTSFLMLPALGADRPLSRSWLGLPGRPATLFVHCQRSRDAGDR